MRIVAEMNQPTHNLIFLLSLTKTLLRNNPHYKILWLFIRYARRKLDRLTNNEPRISFVPDEILEKIIDENDNDNPGLESCVLGKYSDNNTSKGWHLICSKITRKKYKIFILPYYHDNVSKDEIVICETMKYNLEQKMGHKLDEKSYFVSE